MSLPIVIQRPNRTIFSKNQILWRFFVFNPADDGCKLDIQIATIAVNDRTGDYTTYELQAAPDQYGYINIYLDDVLDSMLTYQLPSYNGAIIQEATNTVFIKMQYRRISTAEPNTDWIITDPDRYCVKGGIEKLKFDYNNYFANNVAAKPFATWQPDKTFVGLKDQFFISVLFGDAALDQLKLKVIAEWSDTTTDTFTINFPAAEFAYLLYHIKASPEALGINALAAGRQLWRYSLQVIEVAENMQVGSSYFFYADYRTFYKTKVFNYYNSLGGIDHIRMLGDQEDDYTRNFTEGEIYTGSTIVGAPPLTQYLQTNITRLNSFKSDAGFRHTSNEIMSLQDIFTSALIWEINSNNKNLQLWITSKSNPLKKKSDKRFGFALEWQYGFTEQVYTPIDTDLGTGTDGGEEYDVCPIPTGLISAPFTDGDGFSYRQLAVTLTLAVSYYEFQYRLASAIDWIEVSMSDLGPGGFVVKGEADTGPYNWRVRTVCAPDFTSAWVNGDDFSL